MSALQILSNLIDFRLLCNETKPCKLQPVRQRAFLLSTDQRPLQSLLCHRPLPPAHLRNALRPPRLLQRARHHQTMGLFRQLPLPLPPKRDNNTWPACKHSSSNSSHHNSQEGSNPRVCRKRLPLARGVPRMLPPNRSLLRGRQATGVPPVPKPRRQQPSFNSNNSKSRSNNNSDHPNHSNRQRTVLRRNLMLLKPA